MCLYMHHQQRRTRPKHVPETLPITPHFKHQILELNAKITRHQRHRRKQNRNLRKQQSDPRKPLHTVRFLDSNKIEIHHNKRFLLIKTLLDLAKRIQHNAVFEALKADAGGRAKCYA